MTAKEKTKMLRLEAENKELREQIFKHIRIYGEQLIEIIDLRARVELVELAIRGDE